MKPGSIATVLIGIFGIFAVPPLAAEPANSAGISGFDIAKAPTRSDWQYFHRAKEGVRRDRWRYHNAQGRPLGAWAWGWRLGWVRACGKRSGPYCEEILKEALRDDALVVRAEAATIVGRRFEDRGDKGAVKALMSA